MGSRQQGEGYRRDGDPSTRRGRERGAREGPRGGGAGSGGKGKAQEMGAKERSEKLRRRKSSLEEEGQRGSEDGVFALSRGKGRSLLQAGRGRPTAGEAAVPGVPRGPGGPT